MFECIISYNCVIIDPTQLAIFRNGIIEKQCRSTVKLPNTDKTNAIITCENIKNYTAQNWTFVFGSNHDRNASIVNETFIVTFAPFPLENLPDFNITVNEKITSASIFVSDCGRISDMKYLSFQCELSDYRNLSLPNNCTFTCPVEPGTEHTMGIVRFPIPKYNGIPILNDKFPIDIRHKTFDSRKKNTETCQMNQKEFDLCEKIFNIVFVLLFLITIVNFSIRYSKKFQC
jgi:hypothetical protein